MALENRLLKKPATLLKVLHSVGFRTVFRLGCIIDRIILLAEAISPEFVL
jgi:hypothetical protein